MPKLKKPGRGRKRKFQYGDLAEHPRLGWVVVVEWKKYGLNFSQYRVVRVLHPFNGSAYGEAVWVRTHHLRKPEEGELPTGTTTRKSVYWTYLANQRLGDSERGCRCNCCVHTAMKPSDILKDGSYRWEKEVEDD